LERKLPIFRRWSKRLYGFEGNLRGGFFSNRQIVGAR